MASTNPFDLLVDDDNDDVTQLLAKLPLSAPAKKAPAPGAVTAKLPTKPLPPSQAVQEQKNERGGGRFGGRGAARGGRGGRGYNRDSGDNENSNGNTNGFNGGYRPTVEGEVDKFSERRGYSSSRGAYRGARRGGYSNGDADGERPRRVFERRSGTGRGNEFKREGAGRGNWGSQTEEVPLVPEEPVVKPEKNEEPEKPAEQEDGVDVNKENPAPEVEEKEPEAEEMTLEEYEKVLEEKRKALQALKSEERKVGMDKELAKMQVLSSKKSEEEIFVKLGSEKEKRAEKEEKARKSLSINEFLKPAEGEKSYTGGRGRGRSGRGVRGGYGGGNRINDMAAPAIEDVAQFPLLGVK